jgi:sodium/hydrogen antiporter
MISLTVFVSLLFFYSLISQRLERTIITAPIVFTVAGMLMSPALPEILKAGFNAEVLFRLAEIGLVLLLFAGWFICSKKSICQARKQSASL